MLLREYIMLAAGAVAVGTVLIFIVLAVSARAGLDLNENLWVLAIPTVLALVLNIILIEIYRKWRGKK